MPEASTESSNATLTAQVLQRDNSFRNTEQAALHPTEAQQTDVMFLRQLYYGSVGSLAHEHKQLLQQLPSGAAESAAQAATRLTSIRLTAQQLQDKEHTQRQMYLQLLSVYRRGVTMLTK
ncbi:MAG: hypothetical protein FRX49_09308 [Trebouxia sp. A1-2]|nr:MAG: hypothetical protein FRX49_09308 [Trebouxia sp. A1-2]